MLRKKYIIAVGKQPTNSSYFLSTWSSIFTIDPFVNGLTSNRVFKLTQHALSIVSKGINYSKIVMLGLIFINDSVLPRNDWLIKSSYQLPLYFQKKDNKFKSEAKDRQFIFYVPIFRKGDNGVYDSSTDAIKQLRKRMDDQNVVLGIRAHINRNVLHALTGNEFPKAYENLCIYDKIIQYITGIPVTVYSSIWVDYLFMNQPIIGFCYDWNDYMQIRFLTYGY